MTANLAGNMVEAMMKRDLGRGSLSHQARCLGWLLALAGWLVPVPAAAGVSVATGSGLFTSKACATCHADIAGNASKILNGANSAAAISAAVVNVATMNSRYKEGGSVGALSADDLLSLALYIGTFVAPTAGNATHATTPGTPITINVYPLLGAGVPANDLVTVSGASRGSVSVVAVPADATAASYRYDIVFTPQVVAAQGGFDYSVSNGPGNAPRTASGRVTVNIGNALPPAVTTNPAALNATCGQPFAAQVLASRPPITAGSYAAAPLPAGLSIDANSGAISGTPQVFGDVALVLSAKNDIGQGLASTTLRIACAPPTVSAAALTVRLNTAAVIDLGARIVGFKVSGVNVTAAPAHGAVVVSGTQVIYTPRHDYFGPDAFSVIAFNPVGASAPATVSVQVVGRPDPASNAGVTGLLGAQAAAARRFAGAQQFNIQRRLESLRGQGGASPAAAAAAIQGPLATPLPAEPTAWPSTWPSTWPDAMRPISEAAPLTGSHTAAALAALPQWLPSLAPGGSDVQPLLALARLAQGATLDVADVERLAGGGLPGGRGVAGVWLAGGVQLGQRKATAQQAGMAFDSDGLTLGLDRRFGASLLAGVALGHGLERSDIGNDGTRSRARAQSVSLYASLQAAPRWHVDALIGRGRLHFSGQRPVEPIDDVALLQRRGSQWFGSLATAYERRLQRLLLAPYLRLDLGRDKLDAASETGAGSYALNYLEQQLPTRRVAAGLRAESAHATRWGVATPRLRIEYQRELRADSAARLNYADDAAATLYSVQAQGVDRHNLLLGLGLDFLSHGGLRLGLDYTAQASGHGAARSQGWMLRLEQALGGTGVPGAVQERADTRMRTQPLQFEVSQTFDDNITRAKDVPDRLADELLRLSVSRDVRRPLSATTQATYRATLGLEAAREFSSLSRALAEFGAELNYRASGEFLAPTYGVFARLALDNHLSAQRDGARLAVGATVRAPLTDRIGLGATLAHSVRAARSRVFDGADNSLRANADYRLSPDAVLYAGLEWRQGDVVSTGRSSLDNLDLAEVFAPDDAFASRGLLSYRFEARTRVARLGLGWRLGPDNGLDLSWTQAQSLPRQQAAFIGAQRAQYRAQQWRLAYQVRY